MLTDPVLILTALGLPLLLVVSGFFSGSETALFSLSQHARRQLTRPNTIVGGALRSLLAERRDLLITVLLGNMTINVLYFVISTVALLRLGEEHQAAGWLVALLTPLPLVALVLLGEVLPKLVASNLAPAYASVTAVPLLLVHRALGPLRLVLKVGVITPLARLIAPPQAPPQLSGEELEALLQLSQQRGVIEQAEEQMLQQVLLLGQLKVKDLMTPRVDVEYFDIADGPANLIDLMRTTGLSKVPVCEGDLDHVMGVAYARQVLLREPRTREQLMPLVRQIMIVPELQRADRLLVQLRKTGSTFALAVDEYGGTAGVVTLEDVVEHMVGDIAGPYEAADGPAVQALSPGLWRVSAELPVHEWVSVFGPIGEAAGVSTMGGLVMARLGRLPREADRTIIRNIEIEVEKMGGRRIQTLLIRLVDRPGQPPSEGRLS